MCYPQNLCYELDHVSSCPSCLSMSCKYYTKVPKNFSLMKDFERTWVPLKRLFLIHVLSTQCPCHPSRKNHSGDHKSYDYLKYAPLCNVILTFSYVLPPLMHNVSQAQIHSSSISHRHIKPPKHTKRQSNANPFVRGLSYEKEHMQPPSMISVQLQVQPNASITYRLQTR